MEVVNITKISVWRRSLGKRFEKYWYAYVTDQCLYARFRFIWYFRSDTDVKYYVAIVWFITEDGAMYM